jgi:hypothetical protein
MPLSLCRLYTSHFGITAERLIRKDLEASGRGLLKLLFRNLPTRTKENQGNLGEN